MPDLRKIYPWLGYGAMATVIAFIVGLVFFQPDDGITYTVEPERMSVGQITDRYVELTGTQCFSVPAARTVSTEVWKFSGGRITRPENMAPFYRAGTLATEYGSGLDAIPLDATGCSSFVRFRQPIPTDLQADLAEVPCGAVTNMYVELVVEAVDVATGQTSATVFWDSEPIPFMSPCT